MHDGTETYHILTCSGRKGAWDAPVGRPWALRCLRGTSGERPGLPGGRDRLVRHEGALLERGLWRG